MRTIYRAGYVIWLAACATSEPPAEEAVVSAVDVALPERMQTGAAIDGDLSGDLRPEARALILQRVYDPGSAPAAAVTRPALAAASPPVAPASIRVWRRGVDHSTSSCSGRVDTLSLERYVRGVVPHEWIPSWGSESLKAGAVAVRTYAAYWISHGGKYPCAAAGRAGPTSRCRPAPGS